MTDVLEAVIDEVMAATMDTAVRGRVIAALVQTAVKLLELGDINQRLEKGGPYAARQGDYEMTNALKRVRTLEAQGV